MRELISVVWCAVVVWYSRIKVPWDEIWRSTASPRENVLYLSLIYFPSLKRERPRTRAFDETVTLFPIPNGLLKKSVLCTQGDWPMKRCRLREARRLFSGPCLARPFGFRMGKGGVEHQNSRYETHRFCKSGCGRKLPLLGIIYREYMVFILHVYFFELVLVRAIMFWKKVLMKAEGSLQVALRASFSSADE